MRSHFAVALLVATGCTRQLPPAATPDRVAPTVTADHAPPAGSGRLIVDVVDGSTPIERIALTAEQVSDEEGTRFRFDGQRHPLCEGTPCVADLPIGTHLISFPVVGDPGGAESELLYVGEKPSVYRRALSAYGDTGAGLVFGIVGTSVGAAAMITGIALLPVGLSDGDDGMAAAGGIVLGVGTILVVVGIIAMWLDAETYRPGSAIHFDLE